MSPEDLQKYRIEKIHARYCRNVMAGKDMLVHHGDCDIYTATRMCSCGLLHDLQPLDEPEKIYPKYSQEYIRQARMQQFMEVSLRYFEDAKDALVEKPPQDQQQIDAWIADWKQELKQEEKP